MTPRRPSCSSAARLALTCVLAGASATAAPAVSFRKEIAPWLVPKCAACHGPDKTKGGYQLHTFEALGRPGDSKEPPLVAGRPAESKLFQLVTAADEDDRMPQKDEPLTRGQIALLERWIQEGAKFDGPNPKAPLASLLAPSQHPDPPAAYPRAMPVRALAFSPDGRELAAAGLHEVTVWNPDTGALVRRIRDLPGQIHALAYSPDGAWLAAAGGTPGQTGELKLFDPRSARATNALALTGDTLLAVAFSPDSQRLAASGADPAIRLFSLPSGKPGRVLEYHADWVPGLAFSPDGATLASASRDKTARLAGAQTGALEETYAGHSEAVFAIAFSTDGKNIFSAGRDRKIHCWLAGDGKKIAESPAFDGDVLRVIVSGERVFSCTADGAAREHKLQAKEKEKKFELVREFAGRDSARDALYALAFHEASGRLATAGYAGRVTVWNAADGAVMAEFSAAPGLKPSKATAGR